MRNRLFRSESFFQAALYAGLFAIALAVLFVVVFVILDRSFKATLLREVNDDLGAIAATYVIRVVPGESPDYEAWEVIEGRLRDPDGDDAFLLQRGNRRVAGNIPVMAQPREGVFIMPMPANARSHGHGHRLLGRGTFVAPGVYAYVGRDLIFVSTAETYLLYAFVAVFVISLVLAAASGIFLSRKFLRRVDDITETCQRIMSGRLSERIPQGAPGHEFRRLGGAINAMLDRIEALMESLRQVSNDIAHDMRTPLTHLRQKLEKARDEADTPVPYSAAVDGAIADCDKALGIFAALLRIAQIESGQRRSEFSPLDLAALTTKVAELYRPEMEDAGRCFTVTATGAVTVHGDAQLLMQMIANLLDNAITHTPPGTAVQLSCAITEGQAMLTVADSGPGVAEAERDKVLRRFYRGEQSRSSPGSGLGLALVAAVAELHEATLSLSDNSPGLKVAVRFPAAVVP